MSEQDNLREIKRAEYIEREIKKTGVNLTREQADQLVSYYDMIVERNRVMNLTRIVDFEDAVAKHFVDSLTLCRVIDPKSVKSVLDIGTGAGFPGVPLAVAYPHLNVTMLDSVGKKIAFVNEVIDALHISGEMKSDGETGGRNGSVRAVQGRAEDLARGEYRENFDLCVSRAVANLSVLAEYVLPFVKKNGCFAAYKAHDCDEELEGARKGIRILGGEIEKIDKFSIGDAGRCLILIRKIHTTPARYPRKAGVPSKQPL